MNFEKKEISERISIEIDHQFNIRKITNLTLFTETKYQFSVLIDAAVVVV
jgi:hypothetical protein